MLSNERKFFNVDSIKQVFDDIGVALKIPVHGLLIGGGAMSLKGIKDVTKDVDIVIVDDTEFREFLSCTYKLGFKDRTSVSPGYGDLEAVVLENDEEFHIDLFRTSICRKFRIHEEIMERAEHFGSFGNLTISLMSNEDLFISKSTTERDRDLEDMYTMYLIGLDERIIIKEMAIQDSITKFLWEAFMGVKLDELEEAYEITVPWKEGVKELALTKWEKE
jgi:predicted nucleotidyltransferase